jgi:hypothetical protein
MSAQACDCALSIGRMATFLALQGGMTKRAPEEHKKNPNAVKLGRLGGQKGGAARAEARWGKR